MQVIDGLFFGVVLFVISMFFHFLSCLVGFNTLARFWKIGVGKNMFRVAMKRRFSLYGKSKWGEFVPNIQLVMVQEGQFYGAGGWPVVLQTDLEFTLPAKISDSIRDHGEG